jgi:hypothetical protein
VSRSEFSKQTARAKQGVLMQRRFLLLARIAIPAAMLVVVPIAVLAGGKAEPLRIEFKHGAYGATISESVRGDEEAEYVLGANKGQRLIIKLTSVPDKSSAFEFFGEDDTGHQHDTQFSYSGVLPMTGDYFITVKRSKEAKRTSRYRLAVTVR